MSGGRARSPWLSSTALIFYALLLGVVLGHFLPAETYPWAYESFRFLSKAFINLIKMLVVPLIFSTIVLGIGKTGDVKAVGRMGVKALIYFEVATTIALVIGLIFANLVKPGLDLKLPATGEILSKPKTAVETLLHLFPSNVIDAMAKQDILQIVIFATLLGVAAAHVGHERAKPFVDFFESAVAVLFKLTDYVMALTPLGVFGAMAGAVSHHGITGPRQLREARRVPLRGADRLRARRPRPRPPSLRRLDHALLPEDPRAVPHRVLDGVLARPRSPALSRGSSSSACRRASPASSCPRATASTSTARRCTSSSRR